VQGWRLAGQGQGSGLGGRWLPVAPATYTCSWHLHFRLSFPRLGTVSQCFAVQQLPCHPPSTPYLGVAVEQGVPRHTSAVQPDLPVVHPQQALLGPVVAAAHACTRSVAHTPVHRLLDALSDAPAQPILHPSRAVVAGSCCIPAHHPPTTRPPIRARPPGMGLPESSRRRTANTWGPSHLPFTVSCRQEGSFASALLTSRWGLAAAPRATPACWGVCFPAAGCTAQLRYCLTHPPARPPPTHAPTHSAHLPTHAPIQPAHPPTCAKMAQILAVIAAPPIHILEASLVGVLRMNSCGAAGRQAETGRQGQDRQGESWALKTLHACQLCH
jgi:hypothetical protein